jgi:hypothetical protein
MKITKLIKMNLFSALLLTTSYSHAELQLSVGKVLNKTELSQLKSTRIQLGEQFYDVIPSLSSPNETYLINTQHVVGINKNTVIVSDISLQQFKSQAQDIINLSSSIQNYEHFKIVSLQFSEFNKTVDAYNKLIKRFKNSKVSIPIQFYQPKPR